MAEEVSGHSSKALADADSVQSDPEHTQKKDVWLRLGCEAGNAAGIEHLTAEQVRCADLGDARPPAQNAAQELRAWANRGYNQDVEDGLLEQYSRGWGESTIELVRQLLPSSRAGEGTAEDESAVGGLGAALGVASPTAVAVAMVSAKRTDGQMDAM